MRNLSNCFVQLIQCMGDDLSVVNAARVSMNKRSYSLETKDKKLISFLIRNMHTSPFRHQYLTFHIRAPIFVLRQWQKHQVGCSWNEKSLRYVKHDGDMWYPNLWRQIPEKSIKQGSGGPLDHQEEATALYKEALDFSQNTYERLLELGVCREQARAVLPLSMITECWWTVSLQAALHFLFLRKEATAQNEIQMFATEIEKHIEEKFPVCLDAWRQFHEG